MKKALLTIALFSMSLSFAKTGEPVKKNDLSFLKTEKTIKENFKPEKTFISIKQKKQSSDLEMCLALSVMMPYPVGPSAAMCVVTYGL